MLIYGQSDKLDENNKNSGHPRLAYTELQGGFNMLQLISLDNRSKGCTPIEVFPVPNAYTTF